MYRQEEFWRVFATGLDPQIPVIGYNSTSATCNIATLDSTCRIRVLSMIDSIGKNASKYLKLP